MYLYELQHGQCFTVPDYPELGILVFLKMDGGYGQVQSEDPVVMEKAIARFDERAPFFCLGAMLEVMIS